MNGPSPARRVAFEVVQRVFEEGAYADRAFRAAGHDLADRERAFAMELAYGTVQRVRTLDHAVEAFARRPLRKLDAPVRAALRLGAYQLAFMRSVPVHAAVHQSVELVRAAGTERGVPFTNAVLRRLTVGLRDLVVALPEETPAQAALKHSYPDWIAELWWREWGGEGALALMRAQNDSPETVVRATAKGEGRLMGEPVADLERALRVKTVADGWIEQGLALPQSRGSQLAGLAVGVCPGERVLDLCAAPGGKTIQLAEAAAEVVSVEKHPGRARELELNLRRAGLGNVQVVAGDALTLPAELTGFDRVLVDAPCSGLGVLNSRPDLRWRAEPLPELQRALLEVAVERVKPGGTVTFAVCTMNREENEDVVLSVSAEIEELGRGWPAYAHPRDPRFLLTCPHLHGTSGFFIARLRT